MSTSRDPTDRAIDRRYSGTVFDARCKAPAGREPQPSFHCEEGEFEMRKIVALLMLLSFAALSGCNTIEGAGKDLERGGEKLQGTAKDTKEKM
jgi:predicted small secreted protein